MSLAVINAVWVGPTLGRLHAACLRSFVRNGHRTILHAYERPVDLPEGVELRDAEELLPPSAIIRHSATGSLALFANFLRYEIQARGLGVYIDCDVYSLRPLEDAEYIFGWETRHSICNAVMKLPVDSPATLGLAKLKESPVLIPPWASPRRQFYYRWRARLGAPVKMQDMPWGFLGPRAVTWHLKEAGLDRYAAPIDIYYPLHYDNIPLLLDPGLTIEDISTPRSRCIHLWNNALNTLDLSAIPPSSPLGAMLAA